MADLIGSTAVPAFAAVFGIVERGWQALAEAAVVDGPIAVVIDRVMASLRAVGDAAADRLLPLAGGDAGPVRTGRAVQIRLAGARADSGLPGRHADPGFALRAVRAALAEAPQIRERVSLIRASEHDERQRREAGERKEKTATHGIPPSCTRPCS